jgi:hypothetical protein
VVDRRDGWIIHLDSLHYEGIAIRALQYGNGCALDTEILRTNKNCINKFQILCVFIPSMPMCVVCFDGYNVMSVFLSLMWLYLRIGDSPYRC